MAFIGLIFEYWWLVVLLALVVAAPIYVYTKTVEISSKYTLTRFLIAWPLRFIASMITCLGLVAFSIIPIAVVISIIHAMIVMKLGFSEETNNLILVSEFVAYFGFIFNLTVVETVRNFVREGK